MLVRCDVERASSFYYFEIDIYIFQDSNVIDAGRFDEDPSDEIWTESESEWERENR